MKTTPRPGVVLHRYRNYAQYVDVQTRGNAQKLDHVWVRESSVQFVAAYLLRTLPTPPTFGLCHGTRGGQEQAWFREYLPGCEVIGTEIAPTATQFPHTIQWDFHEVQPAWIGAVDFIYSNSFDHAYDPEKALNAWMTCLRPEGRCVIEHSPAHGPAGATLLDPFGAELAVLPDLINDWGAGRYAVQEILAAPRRRGEKLRDVALLVLARKDAR